MNRNSLKTTEFQQSFNELVKEEIEEKKGKEKIGP